jgi:hypothetical protein
MFLIGFVYSAPTAVASVTGLHPRCFATTVFGYDMLTGQCELCPPTDACLLVSEDASTTILRKCEAFTSRCGVLASLFSTAAKASDLSVPGSIGTVLHVVLPFVILPPNCFVLVDGRCICYLQAARLCVCVCFMVRGRRLFCGTDSC